MTKHMVLGWAVAAAAGLQLLLFGVYVERTIIRRPYADMLDWFTAWLLRQDWPDYLWSPHNEHHMVVIRLLTALDVKLGASGLTFIAAGTIAVGVTAWLVWSEMRRCLAPAVRPLALLAPMLLITSASAVDCSIPINTVYPLCLVCLVGCLCLFLEGRRVAAVGVGAAASLSNAVGLVSWPILLWVAWRRKSGVGWLAGVAMIGAAYSAFYVRGISAVGEVSAASHVARMGLYLVSYLGLPFSRLEVFTLASRVLGGGLLIAGMVVIGILSWPRRCSTRLESVAGGLILIGLSSGILAAVGRDDLELDLRVPVRYALLVAPLHIGLVLLLFSWLSRKVGEQSLLAGGLAVCLVLLVEQVAGGQAAIVPTSLLREEVGEFYAGGVVAHVVYPNAVGAEQMLRLMRQSGVVP